MEIGTKAAQFPDNEYINRIFVAVWVKYYKGCYPVFPPAIDWYRRQETEAPLTRKSWDWSLGFSQCVLFLDWPEQMEGGPGYSSIRIPAPSR